MDAYPESMFKLKPIVAKDIFSKIIDEKKMVEKILSDNTKISNNGSSQKIVSIYLLLQNIQNKLNELKGKVISFDDADYLLQEMILANSEITQFFIEKAQRECNFSYDEVYSQSNIIMDYIKVIRDDMVNMMICLKNMEKA